MKTAIPTVFSCHGSRVISPRPPHNAMTLTLQPDGKILKTWFDEKEVLDQDFTREFVQALILDGWRFEDIQNERIESSGRLASVVEARANPFDFCVGHTLLGWDLAYTDSDFSTIISDDEALEIIALQKAMR